LATIWNDVYFACAKKGSHYSQTVLLVVKIIEGEVKIKISKIM
jgi:hypothetical protein